MVYKLLNHAKKIFDLNFGLNSFEGLLTLKEMINMEDP